MTGSRFASRCVMVTGAGSGIGRATARQLAAEGALVHGVDRDATALGETFDGLTGHRQTVLDLADPSAPEVLDLEALDVLVNAAGILCRHPVLEHPLDDWERTLDVNLRAPRRLCAAFARSHVTTRRTGAIVNVCSIESFTGAPAHLAYTVTKSAVLMLTRALGYELAPHGIRVNGIAPGVTATAMNAALREDATRSEALMAKIPMRRFGDPAEQAQAICFLASDQASYVTGAVLAVDGGWLTA